MQRVKSDCEQKGAGLRFGLVEFGVGFKLEGGCMCSGVGLID